MPAVIAVVFAVTAMEKVVVLTLWLVWLVLVLTFLVVVEFIRDNIERQASLNAMTDDEVRTLFAARKVFMQPTMAGASAGGASTRSASGVPSRTSALDEKDSAKLDALMAELLSRGSKEVVGRHAHGRTDHGEGAGVGKSAGAKAESLKGAAGVVNATNVGTAGAADAADVAGDSAPGGKAVARSSTPPSASGSKSDENGEVR